MYQIDNSTAVPAIPASTALGTPGFFSDGNPATGAAATIVPAEWLNMVMMEILGVLSAAGVAPSKSTFTQLATAIRAVNRQAVILADTGTANAYAAANTPALTALPATGYLQRVNIATLNTTASTYSPDGLPPKPIYGMGLQALQGGELPAGVATFMYLVQAGVNSGNGAWILLESLGGAVQVANATKSQQALAAGQFLATLTGNDYLKMPVLVDGVMRTLILQWCTSSAIAAGGAGSVTLPTTFPNATLYAMAAPLGNASNGNAGNVVAGTATNSSVPLWNWGSISASAKVLAIGW